MHPARLLTASLLLSATLLGQTSTPTPAKKTAPATTHHTTTTHRPAAAPKVSPMDTLLGIPTLPASIPPVTGQPKPLYALSFVDITPGTGTGAEPAPGKWLTVHYTGWLVDGTKFDSSVDRGEPFTFQYGARHVISGWDTGFEGMKVGGKRRLYIPWQLAYGAFGRAPVIPAKAMLIFDMELLSVDDNPPAPKSAPSGQRR